MNSIRKILVSGHRNPDLDSLASSYALAELRRRQGLENVVAICPGVLSARGKYLFERFHLTPPDSRSDLYLRVRDVMKPGLTVVSSGTTLLEAVKQLNKSGYPRLPVVGEDGVFLGMLSPLTLLSHLLDIGHDLGFSLTGRLIHSSIDLITQVLKAEVLTGCDTEVLQAFKVYVCAMGVDSFETHLPNGEDRELALICGDRPEIHLRVLERRIRLLIVTGNRSPEPLIIQAARQNGVTILHTRYDSATAIRRLRFSVPVDEFTALLPQLTLHPKDRLHNNIRRIMNNPEDVIPVVEDNGHYLGAILKQSLSEPPPYQMILVDHNEPEQSLPGIEEIPVIEVVDHHRIGMRPTTAPIKITGDIVGSTCTLVAEMYRGTNTSLSPSMAGLLLGGLVSDTLNLKSPTTSDLDRDILAWLETISGVKAETLMAELQGIESLLSSQDPMTILDSDRKSYTNGKYHFALSQVEDTKLELLHQRQTELLEAMTKIRDAERLDFIGLMVTDVTREISELLVLGTEDIVLSLPYPKLSDCLYSLPGVLSRKKQLLPQILYITNPQ